MRKLPRELTAIAPIVPPPMMTRRRLLYIALAIALLATIIWLAAVPAQITVRGETCPPGYSVAYVERSTTGAVLFTTCARSDSSGGRR